MILASNRDGPVHSFLDKLAPWCAPIYRSRGVVGTFSAGVERVFAFAFALYNLYLSRLPEILSP